MIKKNKFYKRLDMNVLTTHRTQRVESSRRPRLRQGKQINVQYKQYTKSQIILST